MVKDPVCGLEVDEETATATSTYKENTYYFCGKGCKIGFDKEPEKHLGKTETRSMAVRNGRRERQRLPLRRAISGAC